MAVGANQPFGNIAGTLTITTSAAASVSGALPAGQQDGSVLVTNGTTGIVFVRLDAGPASASDIPVPANGGRILLNAGAFVTSASVFAPSLATAGPVYFTRGAGSTY